MLARARSGLSFANVVSVIALIVAVGGGTAVALQGKNTVRSDDIAPGQVKTQDIAKNSITGSQVKVNSLLGDDLRDGTILGADIGDGAVGSAEIGAGAVTLSRLAPTARPTSFIYSRPLGSLTQETVLDADGIRLQASCEEVSNRPRLKVFLTVSSDSTYSVHGGGFNGSSSFTLGATFIPVAANTPTLIEDLFSSTDTNAAQVGRTIVLRSSAGSAMLILDTKADDGNDTCVFSGVLYPRG